MAKPTVASILPIPTCRRKPRLKNLSLIPATVNLVMVDWRAALSTTISLGDIHVSRNNCHELSSTELDLVVLRAIQSSLNCGEVSESGRLEKKRERTRMTFFFHGKRICKEEFLFLHCISRTKFCSLVKHYKKNGLTLRSHGNKKRLPSSTFSVETVDNVVKFILKIKLSFFLDAFLALKRLMLSCYLL